MSRSGLEFWRDQKVFLVGMGILYASVVPFLLALERYPHNDVRLYFETTQALFSGEWPYRDRTFEYPPFALLWYVLPTLAGSLRGFQFWFAIEILRLLLFVLLPFVAFNIVLSPQYMIWLLVLAAAALLPVAGGTNAAPGLAPGSKSVALAIGSISLMTAVTPVWYPTPEFGSGLRLGQTVVLLARNLGLIGVWIGLGWLLWRGWAGFTDHGDQGQVD